jgi:5'-nucleotidase
MKSIAALLSCLALTAVSIQAHLNVVLTNDDGFGSANIRAVYNELKKQNHNVLIVGPADQQSGKGGVSISPIRADLVQPGADKLVWFPWDDRRPPYGRPAT